MLIVGDILSTAGTGLEIVNDIFEGNLSVLKTSQKLFFYAIGTKLKKELVLISHWKQWYNDVSSKADKEIDKLREE